MSSEIDPAVEEPINRDRYVPRRILILAMALTAILPPIGVVSYAILNPVPPEAKLHLQVSEVVIAGGKLEAMEGIWDAETLYPAIEVVNESDDVLRNLTLLLNKDFIYRHRSPLPARGTLTVPLLQFTTKDGGIPLPARTSRLRQATVFAQLPNGDRGVAEVSLAQ